jgi:hypothetical protein
MKLNYLILLLLLGELVLTPSLCAAQSAKNEVEESINQKDIPALALSSLNEFWNEEKKADFYRQIDGKKISYEVKFDWEGHLYSFQFDSTGLLIDIEQLVEFDELSQPLRNTITEEIDKQYSKFKFTRVQRQFLNLQKSNNSIIKAVKSGSTDRLIIHYEIEIDGQNKDDLGSFELLFDVNGNLIQKRRIVRRSLDNIW